jgi:hypothetical protein
LRLNSYYKEYAAKDTTAAAAAADEENFGKKLLK